MEKRIEQYLTNQLEGSEKKAFEKEMAGNPSLSKKVKEHRFTLKAIRLEGRSKLKNRLSQLDVENADINSGEKKTFLPKKDWILFLAFLLIVFFSWFIFKNNTPTKTEPPVEIIEEREVPEKNGHDIKEKTKPVPPIGTTPPLKQNKPTNKPSNIDRPIAQKNPVAPDNKKLFAQHFEPYHHPSMRPTIRGQGELTTREQFEKAYWEKDFKQVLKLWDDLNGVQKSNGNLFFLKAVALMKQGSINEAEKDFSELIILKRHRFVQQSEWYLALARLFNDDKTEAKKMLNKIIENTGHQKNQAALDLIKKIE